MACQAWWPGDRITAHPLLPTPCPPSVVQRDALAENLGNAKFRKGAKGALLREAFGGQDLGSSPDLDDSFRFLLASLSPSVTGRIVILIPQPSLTCSLAQQHLLRTLCEPDAGGVTGSRGVQESKRRSHSLLELTHWWEETDSKQASRSEGRSL